MSLARWIVAAACAACATVAAAQEQPTANPLRDRTGPEAAPEPTPDYARPAPPLMPERVPPVPPAPPIPNEAAAPVTMRFREVRIDVPVPGMAPVRRGWRPADPGDGLVLAMPASGRLDASWVRKLLETNRMIGQPVAPDRLVQLVQAINLAYVQSGYINSGILVAGETDGMLRLRLVYGGLAGNPKLTVGWGPQGRKGLTPSFIRHRFPSSNQTPLDATAVERDFRLLAANPAVRSVDATLHPGDSPGEASLGLTVAPARRGDFYLDVANSRSPSIGGWRESMGGSLRNALTAGDVVSAEAGLTAGHPDAEAGYSAPLFGPRDGFSLRGSYDDAAVVASSLLPLDIRAREWSAEGALNHTVIARPLLPVDQGNWSPAQSLVLGVGVIHRRTESFLLGQPFSFSPGSVNGIAEYTALRFTADFTEQGLRHVTAASLTVTQGLEGTRSDVVGAAAPPPTFHAALLQISHALRLDGNGLELRLRFTGQLAGSVLYSAERLSAGGAYTVRGYRETLALADQGAIGSIELAHPFVLGGNQHGATGLAWGRFSASVFSDGAVLGNKAEPAPAPDRLASVGASLSWTPSDAIFARVTYAAALIDAPPVGGRDIQDDGLSFRLTIRPFLLFKRG